MGQSKTKEGNSFQKEKKTAQTDAGYVIARRGERRKICSDGRNGQTKGKRRARDGLTDKELGRKQNKSAQHRWFLGPLAAV